MATGGRELRGILSSSRRRHDKVTSSVVSSDISPVSSPYASGASGLTRGRVGM